MTLVRTPVSFVVSFSWAQALPRDWAAKRRRLLKIGLNGLDAVRPHEIRRALEVVIQAAVIQIDRPDHGLCIVDNKALGMDEPRRKLQDFHPDAIRLA